MKKELIFLFNQSRIKKKGEIPKKTYFQMYPHTQEQFFFTYLNCKESKKNASQLPPFLFLVNGDRYRNLLDNRNRNVHLLDVVYRNWNSHLFHVVDGNRNRDWHLLHYGYRYLLHVMMMNRVHVIRHVDTNVVRTEIGRIRLGFLFLLLILRADYKLIQSITIQLYLCLNSF